MIVSAAVLVVILAVGVTWFVLSRSDFGDGTAVAPPVPVVASTSPSPNPVSSTDLASDLLGAAPSEAGSSEGAAVPAVTVTEVIIAATPTSLAATTVVLPPVDATTPSSTSAPVVAAPSLVSAPTAVAPPGTGDFAPMTTVVRDSFPMTVSPVTATESAGAGTTFRTPSGQIICEMTTSAAICWLDPDGIEYAIPAGPSGCSGTWGYSVVLTPGAGAGEWDCANRTWSDQPGLRELAFGTALAVGYLRCATQQVGVTCLDDSGHGFRISRRDGAIFY